MFAEPKVLTASSRGTGPRALGRAASQNRRRIRENLRRSSLGLLYVAPALIFLGATFLYPLAYNVWLSLHSYNLAELYLGTRFIGLRNYVEILHDPYFWNGFRNSVFLTLACLALELPIGMALALILQARLRGHSVFRFVFILPLLLIPSVT